MPAEPVWALFRHSGGLLQWFSGAAGCAIADGKASGSGWRGAHGGGGGPARLRGAGAPDGL